MKDKFFSEEVLVRCGCHFSSCGRYGDSINENIAVFVLYENQIWFLDDCLSGTLALYEVNFAELKTTKLDSFSVDNNDPKKLRDAVRWYEEIQKRGR